MRGYVDFLQDVFRDLGDVDCRRMFGGIGIFFKGVMFALAVDEIVYLKADDKTAPSFVAQGLPPFSYLRGGKEVTLSYYQAPEEIFDDSVLARRLGEQSWLVALRGQKKKAGKD